MPFRNAIWIFRRPAVASMPEVLLAVPELTRSIDIKLNQ
jgi:hypothetical protein